MIASLVSFVFCSLVRSDLHSALTCHWMGLLRKPPVTMIGTSRTGTWMMARNQRANDRFREYWLSQRSYKYPFIGFEIFFVSFSGDVQTLSLPLKPRYIWHSSKQPAFLVNPKVDGCEPFVFSRTGHKCCERAPRGCSVTASETLYLLSLRNHVVDPRTVVIQLGMRSSNFEELVK